MVFFFKYNRNNYLKIEPFEIKEWGGFIDTKQETVYNSL